MGDYSSIGQQQSSNFSQSTAFAAALQRAKQVSLIHLQSPSGFLFFGESVHISTQMLGCIAIELIFERFFIVFACMCICLFV